MRRRIYSEEVTAGTLCSPAVIELLSRYELELLVAVRPDRLDESIGAVRLLRDAGISVGVWPMLDDRDGRWASGRNGDRFGEFARRVLGRLDDGGAPPRAFVLDLEPPIHELKALSSNVSRVVGDAARGPLRRSMGLAGALTSLSGRAGAPAGVALQRLVDEIAASDVELFSAIVPPLVWDRGGLARLLDTPVPDPSASVVSPMMYTTLLTGYAGGVFRRPDATALLHEVGRAARVRYGHRASLSLGAVGRGALGDEATYSTPVELAEDVAIARAAGVDDLALFALDGVLARPPADAWLDAFCRTEPARRIPRTVRARAVRYGAGALAGALSLFGRS